MEKQSFDARLANSLNEGELKTQQIRLNVLRHCENAGFIDSDDKASNSLRYQWLTEVLEINLMSLSLLDQINVDFNYSLIPADLQTEVTAKAAVIVKDIAKRLMEAEVVYPSFDGAMEVGGSR
ncbi:hypothetical protein [Vibrio parahaemolyticus]|uniref:hypothetical protein n=2 Tax=Vibrio parahaemolyticus TaxID=670 RepID=UPI001122A417|nr:hypothetical protein [Vibrio parahaemolyticus]EIV8506043.1 hypothetical protein [Vibrio parahaemolyticus]EJG1030449.1 hypothetical protein [Vibrio parahaemolyticus]TOL31796.1 hypothetical protein CGI01_15735 [Vibrio parahaemolyticus]